MKIKNLLICLSILSTNVAIADDTPRNATAISSIASLPSPASSDEGELAAPTISPMLKGQKAPFNGILLNAPAVATIKVELDTAKEKCAIEITKQVSVCQANCDLKLAVSAAALEKEKAISSVLIKSRDQTIIDISKKLEDSEKSRPNPVVWAGVGIVAGVVVTLASVLVVSLATK